MICEHHIYCVHYNLILSVTPQSRLDIEHILAFEHGGTICIYAFFGNQILQCIFSKGNNFINSKYSLETEF